MTGRIILAGNPNVGKSTLFNRLTGLKQHTGNWSGKTVGSACGHAVIGGRNILIIDTPGTYSLFAPASPDEELARDCICGDECDCIIVVCNGCCLERSLYLALQIIEKQSNVIVCVNLMDEAAKKGIHIDFDALSMRLGVPAFGISAARDSDLDALEAVLASHGFHGKSDVYHSCAETEPMALKKRASDICEGIVSYRHRRTDMTLAIDRLLTHRILSWPIMLCLLLFILWLSIYAANYPSELLSRFFDMLGSLLKDALSLLKLPMWAISMLIDGVYGTTAWVISVMLPPMAIFFPLFTLLEDWGLLPRIAFNMDGIFKKCGSCGKQALTMCMGLGCNAVGVTGCRIIASRREKLIAAVTNAFMPCNGRFPTIIVLSSLLFSGRYESLYAAIAVLGAVVLGVVLTFFTSKLLSASLLKGAAAAFTLELPPFRKPKICDTLLRSLLDRTVYVLLRAIKAAAPAGLLIWLLGNISYGGTPLLELFSGLLDPIGTVFGLDGAILIGFMLGLPANEIVLPVIMMCYVSGGALSSLPPTEELQLLFAQQGWTEATVLCLMVFTLLHWPCATTLMTIKKECGGLRYALLAFLLPTLWGLMICFMINLVM